MLCRPNNMMHIMSTDSLLRRYAMNPDLQKCGFKAVKNLAVERIHYNEEFENGQAHLQRMQYLLDKI